MKEEIWNDFRDFARLIWQEHRYPAVGLLLGCMLGMSILIFGMFNTLFVLLCSLAGLYIGVKLDRGEDVSVSLHRILPGRFQRW